MRWSLSFLSHQKQEECLSFDEHLSFRWEKKNWCVQKNTCLPNSWPSSTLCFTSNKKPKPTSYRDIVFINLEGWCMLHGDKHQNYPVVCALIPRESGTRTHSHSIQSYNLTLYVPLFYLTEHFQIIRILCPRFWDFWLASGNFADIECRS